jgi:hypothetical protein
LFVSIELLGVENQRRIEGVNLRSCERKRWRSYVRYSVKCCNNPLRGSGVCIELTCIHYNYLRQLGCLFNIEIRSSPSSRLFICSIGLYRCLIVRCFLILRLAPSFIVVGCSIQFNCSVISSKSTMECHSVHSTMSSGGVDRIR